MEVGSLGSERGLSLGESQPAEVWTLPLQELWCPVTKCHTSCRSPGPQRLRAPTRWPQGPSKKVFQLISYGYGHKQIIVLHCSCTVGLKTWFLVLPKLLQWTKMRYVTTPDVNRLSAVLWNLADIPKSTNLIPASFVNKMLVPLTSRWVTLWLLNPGTATVPRSKDRTENT